MFRLLLTGLLAIALPMKALAAVTMVGCGPVHHGARGNVAVPVAAPAAQHDQGSQVASQVPSDAHHGAHHGTPSEPAPDQGGQPAGTADGGKQHSAKMANGQCSTCAPCCAAAAPAPDAHRFVGMEPACDQLPSATETYGGVIDDVPHKPPRLFLA